MAEPELNGLNELLKIMRPTRVLRVLFFAIASSCGFLAKGTSMLKCLVGLCLLLAAALASVSRPASAQQLGPENTVWYPDYCMYTNTNPMTQLGCVVRDRRGRLFFRGFQGSLSPLDRNQWNGIQMVLQGRYREPEPPRRPSARTQAAYDEVKREIEASKQRTIDRILAPACNYSTYGCR